MDSDITMLKLPAPDDIPWVCPFCGEKRLKRMIKGFMIVGQPGDMHQTEIRPVLCVGCAVEWTLSIHYTGVVTYYAPDHRQRAGCYGHYSAVDPESQDWIRTGIATTPA